uniref:EGF-like domain-containing protein n=1 Tax=Macrostomum lignano TaxID=282301 RepID=A0A1I8FAU5_9PLAT
AGQAKDRPASQESADQINRAYFSRVSTQTSPPILLREIDPQVYRKSILPVAAFGPHSCQVANVQSMSIVNVTLPVQRPRSNLMRMENCGCGGSGHSLKGVSCSAPDTLEILQRQRGTWTRGVCRCTAQWKGPECRSALGLECPDRLWLRNGRCQAATLRVLRGLAATGCQNDGQRAASVLASRQRVGRWSLALRALVRHPTARQRSSRRATKDATVSSTAAV